jgi:hypothetical protein
VLKKALVDRTIDGWKCFSVSVMYISTCVLSMRGVVAGGGMGCSAEISSNLYVRFTDGLSHFVRMCLMSMKEMVGRH